MSKSLVISIFFCMHSNNLNLFQEIEGPAPDIWVWGLEPGLGYLPHVRRRPRLFWNKFEHNLAPFFLSNRILFRGNRSSMILIYVKGALSFLLFSLLFPILPFQENCQKTPINARKQTFPRFWDGQTFVEWERCREPTNTFAKLPIKSTHWFSGWPSIQK